MLFLIIPFGAWCLMLNSWCNLGWLCVAPLKIVIQHVSASCCLQPLAGARALAATVHFQVGRQVSTDVASMEDSTGDEPSFRE